MTLVGAAALGLPALVASAVVVATAVDADHQVDALGPAALALLIGLGVPAVFVVARARRWPPVVTAVGVVVTVGLVAGTTAWLVRPQAPDGSAHPFTYDEAVRAVSTDATAWLESVAPGRWEQLHDARPTPCDDRFGRERGAGYGGPSYRVDAVLTPAQVDDLEHTVADAPERELQAEAYGRPTSFRGQDQQRIVIRLNTLAGEDTSTVEVVTPCLRAG